MGMQIVKLMKEMRLHLKFILRVHHHINDETEVANETEMGRKLTFYTSIRMLQYIYMICFTKIKNKRKIYHNNEILKVL